MVVSNMDVTNISEEILHHWVLLVFVSSVCYVGLPALKHS
jgi:hypothetical protein